MGFSIPPEAWDEKEFRVTPAAYNHKNTPSSTINALIVAMEKAVNRLENFIGFGKDSETLEDVVIYQALYGAGQI